MKMKTKIKVITLICAAAILTAAACGASLFVVRGYRMYRDALNARELTQLAADIQSQRGFAPLSEMPQTYRDAVIAVEDHRFYRHGGIDPIAIGRALLVDIRTFSFAEGGSTITQQLAKNQYFTQEKKLERKVAEVFMAFAIEKQFSKDEILEMYLNSIYFGDGYYGVGQASQGYFGITPEQLGTSQATMLAGIPNAPSAYALTASPDLARRRQSQVLQLMVKHGYMTNLEANWILDTPAPVAA